VPVHVGPLAHLDYQTTVLVIILTEIFEGRLKCAYSSVRNVKVTVVILVNCSQNENFQIEISGPKK